MTCLLLVLHRSSPDRLGIRYAVFCGTQMGHTLQLTVAASVTNLVLIPFASQATLSKSMDRASIFLVTAAFTNSGTSLVDTSMVPFQQEYVVLVATALLILAGDTGFVSGNLRFETFLAKQYPSQSCTSVRDQILRDSFDNHPPPICSLRCLMYVHSRVGMGISCLH